MYLIKNFGQREKIAPTGSSAGGHGGGDTRLRDLIFRKADAPAHMRLPDSRAGAMSCLTGIAARKSIDENRPIRIADLVKLDLTSTTMKRIAADLGVSVTTISKVLNHHADIGQATRARVLKRVEELGYRPNAVARSLTLQAHAYASASSFPT